jgi:Mlc titration factor MtfA (ptsG expression regulator)
MLFAWLKSRRRRKLLAEPFPPQWLRYLDANVAHYRVLNDAERAKLRDDLRVVISEKDWEGCGGQAIDDEVKITVAGQACLLVLGMRANYFDQVTSILVYPHGYLVPQSEPIGYGVALEGEVAQDGTAHRRGPVILSWREALAEGRDPGLGRNVVLHEFAHQLDMQDGEFNGAPLLNDAELECRWRKVMTAEYERLIADVDAGRPTVVDAEGATSPTEFFAYATERFFTRPRAMRRHHRALYNLFRDYYCFDPAERMGHEEG